MRKKKLVAYVFGVAVLFVMGTVGCAASQPALAGHGATVQQVDVNWHPQSGEGAVPEARARLVRTPDNINVSFHARELNPGHVYTLWMVIVNEPELCAAYPGPCTAADDVLGNTAGVRADVTYGGGIIAGNSGQGTLSGYLATGDLPGSWFGNGLENAGSAEIHLVVNDHGPLIPGAVSDMLKSYRGGCTDESLPAAFPETAKADGEPGPNTCRLYQSAVFQPAG